jgi:uncharacterized protein
MKTAIIIHGRPDKEEYYDLTVSSPSNAHWLPWLQKQLCVNDILAQTPEMPEPYAPDYEKWKAVFEKFQVDENTALIGHSRGGSFLLHWLSENKVNAGKVILVAPSITPNMAVERGFWEYTIDSTLPERVAELILFYSMDDDTGIIESAEKVITAIPAITVRKFEDRGHFTFGDLGTIEFPELLKEII